MCKIDSKLREKLLLRMFSSVDYMNAYSKHFIEFISAGILAFEAYEKILEKPVSHSEYSNVTSDIHLWKLKVIPNFLNMKNNMKTSIAEAKQGDYSGISAAAGNFRGLSKDMDGIRESFMDFIDPALKERYFSEWKITSTMSDNLYKTLEQRWRSGSILKESITGPIDDMALLKFLQDGETI